MASEKVEGLEGVVEEKLPQGLYRVRVSDGQTVLATLTTEAQRVTVRILPGDRVKLEMSALDPSRGRITMRQG